MKEYVYVGQCWFGDEYEAGYSVVKAFKSEEDAKVWFLECEVGERTYVRVEVE